MHGEWVGEGGTAGGGLSAHVFATPGTAVGPEGQDADSSPAQAALARELIDECIGKVTATAAKADLKEEIKATEFFDVVVRGLMPLHNKFVTTPGARMGDREAALVTQLFKTLGLERHDYLTCALPDTAQGAKWGNFFEALHKKLMQKLPSAFLTVYTREAPATASQFALLTSFSSEAAAAAERMAERLQREQFGGVRTSAYHRETLEQESLVPWHHRGRVPKCMKEYQNLIVLPLRRCIAHAVPSTQCLKAISKLGPVIEVGAGAGYWTAMLQERGVDAVAYDLDPPDPEVLTNGFAFRPFTTVHKADGISLFQTDPDLASRTLLLVWPGEFDGPQKVELADGSTVAPPGWETSCINAFLQAGGTHVVYVGEREEAIERTVGTAPDTGVSASKAFQRVLLQKMHCLETYDVPTLFYTCDDMTIWKRR